MKNDILEVGQRIHIAGMPDIRGVVMALSEDGHTVFLRCDDLALPIHRIETMPKPSLAPNSLYCSFCRKQQQEVSVLIAGVGSYICNACVAVCAEIVKEQAVLKKKSKRKTATASPPAPPTQEPAP